MIVNCKVSEPRTSFADEMIFAMNHACPRCRFDRSVINGEHFHIGDFPQYMTIKFKSKRRILSLIDMIFTLITLWSILLPVPVCLYHCPKQLTHKLLILFQATVGLYNIRGIFILISWGVTR